MKRKLAALKTSLLAAVLAVMLAACSVQSTQAAVPDLGQVRSICSLATLECYYHNVAKSTKTAGGGITGIFERDRTFWIEYDGIRTLGIGYVPGRDGLRRAERSHQPAPGPGDAHFH